MKRLFTHCRLVSVNTLVNEKDGYQVQEDVSIAVENGVIKHIGLNLSQEGYDVISLEGKLVTPGFIDCHTHIVFAGNRAGEFEKRLNGVPYSQIAKQGGGILSTVTETRNASVDELVSLALPRAKALMADGITTIEVKSGYGLTFEDEIKMLQAARKLADELPLTVSTTLLAAHALPSEYQNRSDDYIEMVCDTLIPEVASKGLADAVDVFCEGIAFSPAQCERVFEAALSYGLKIKAHAEQLSNLGGSTLAARMGALSVDHIEYLDSAGVEALAEHGTIATLLPGAFYFLKETQKPPVELLRKHNVPMALSTDFNPGTSPFASLSLMMNMASTLFGLTPKENLYGVTRHAAQALGLTKKGQIAPGFDADMAVWDLSSPAELSYQIGLSPLAARYIKGELANEY
ncbi:imidazolonepropionase [Photobacterium angustum]|uniref:Imidazolonepropionase n=1 Tax=Photobacterium angustum (strain S14 / CCUG 15956) TaxID=314292 RepID=Q1ZN30_PHOAS|nr:imidazolonepropionase [Photobacterium angustum]EAS63508.1 imidazolonepropionase [Vibrio angustum S14] [Photobacterium angustum S14]